MRFLAATLAGAMLASAPFQCESDPDPSRRIEDTAPEALWVLAERFGQEGDETARRRTLAHLVEMYPSSRYARRAELVLAPNGDQRVP